jgi:hypothetical protein
MPERIDASPSAHVMVGFYEVCPLKALPKVDNVYVSGSADEQIRPEWQQSAARRVLGVEPVVISRAGHANIFTKAKYAAQLADACVKDARGFSFSFFFLTFNRTATLAVE